MNRFRIEGFKCFGAADIAFNRLTVLCGLNGVGKSTIIQALLLYRSSLGRRLRGGVALNDSAGLALGTSDDIVFRGATTEGIDRIRLGFQQSNGTDFDLLELSTVKKESRTKSYLNEEIISRSLFVERLPQSGNFFRKTPFFFTYLSAERQGPRLAQERYSSDGDSSDIIGSQGEYVAEVLLRNERRRIRPELLCHPVTNRHGFRSLLLQATQDWMSHIVGPIEIQVTPNGNAPPSVQLRRPSMHSEWVVSTNTGFGISYSLPIIVAGLLAPIGGVLIVDSPEAHLHPAAQTAVARFLTHITAAGVNVIIETHSDHIIDGIRLAAIASPSRLSASDCTIINLSRDDSDVIEMKKLTIKEDGTLSSWPKGFFDQQVKNARDIANIVRAKNGKTLHIS